MDARFRSGLVLDAKRRDAALIDECALRVETLRSRKSPSSVAPTFYGRDTLSLDPRRGEEGGAIA